MTDPKRGRIELPSGDELERLIGPISMPVASGGWISAREARLLVAETAAVSLDDAAAALCRRALKWLRVRPHTWSRRVSAPEWMRDRSEFQKDYGQPDLTHFSDSPSRTAWEEGLTLFDSINRHVPYFAPASGVTLACWATGDFHVEVQMDFHVVSFELVGLEFDRKGVHDSIGLSEPPSDKRKSKHSGGPGRAPKWDWEGAIASVVAIANTPDGLPTGRGAQAAIERLIAEHFGENCPTESEVRLRAGRLMEALEKTVR